MQSFKPKCTLFFFLLLNTSYFFDIFGCIQIKHLQDNWVIHIPHPLISPTNPDNLQHPDPKNLHPFSQRPSHCKIDHEIRHDTNKRENTKETIKYRYK